VCRSLSASRLSRQVDDRVKMAMNEINAARRLKEAAAEKAEAEKITVVKAAVRACSPPLGFCSG
jgi:hypothetical protein